ncbi:heavy metal-binding domain-containing protein [Pseudophaeobacter sp.]|uniref:heavy metal-binding domain-containing protein n=1 Tax=Pseudophaeobacter sp. TaxID=1971739 RepID=UPI0032984278
MKRILFALPVLLAACGDQVTYPAGIERDVQAVERASETPVEQIPVLVSNTINDGKFEVLAELSTTVAKATAFHPNPTAAQARRKLQVEAAELGADAIINARIGNSKVCALSWACRVSTGTAVKLVN